MSKKKIKKHNKSNFQSLNIKNQLNFNENRIENNVFIYQNQLTIAEFAKVIKHPSIDIIKYFFNNGIMMNQNTMLSEEQIGELCINFDLDLKKEKKITVDNLLENFSQVTDSNNIIKKAPIVTIMGHVDHGKTSLLDKIRNTNVVNSEKGGITQHIGAYQILTPKTKRKITFIDTPGHKAFTEMRARGSKITDMVVIVVAGDDGIKPQTIEALDHVKAAKVNLIVFVNKMDRENTDYDRILNQFAEIDILPEEWGGKVPFIKGSAKTGAGINDLLENIILHTDILELKTNITEYASGVVIEAFLDKSLGPCATLLVQFGKINLSDLIIAGYAKGKIKLMKNDKNVAIKAAYPSDPVRIWGLDNVPKSGDHFMCFGDEKLYKKIASARKNTATVAKHRSNNPFALSTNFFESNTNDIKIKNINIILKTDTFGSAEAIKSSIQKLDYEDTKIHIVRSAVGLVTDTDISLAVASKASIFNFNIKTNAIIMKQASSQNVKISSYTVIYKLLEDIEKICIENKNVELVKETIGKASVRKIFQHSKIGFIAGCLVIEGKILRNSKIDVIRKNEVIFSGTINNLKQGKDTKSEILNGTECGITIKNFNKIQVDDVIESYNMIPKKGN